MRMGIRAKLVGTLLLAGLLPLALALGTILIGVIELRVQSKGRMYRGLARQQARHLSAMLFSQIEVVRVVNGLPETDNFLERANRIPPLSQKEITAIEVRWPGLQEDDAPLKDILQNYVAWNWQATGNNQPHFAEVMITDLSGRLVAATNKTSDYFQADEKWWQDCYNEGKGRVLISGVVFDASAKSSEGKRGTMVADLCVPVYNEQCALVGITKISLDATWMLHQMDLGVQSDDTPRVTWLVRGDGASIRSPGFDVPVDRLSDKSTQRVRSELDGWLVDHDNAGVELIGFSSVEQSGLLKHAEERWHVVVGSSRSDVLSSIYRMGWWILGLGVIVIAACFLGGFWMARREIIRPLQKLEHAVEQIKSGNRRFRLPEARGRKEAFRDDELGRLARDFNVMATQLETNFDRLEAADGLKRQFIDLASHELRTPITYILGAAQLAERKNGSNGSAAIMTKIFSKAQRLNRIVENMFKLLASDRFEKTLRLTEVDVGMTVRMVLQEHEPFLAERRQSFRVDIAPELPKIQADADKLRDIVANLVSNAIRFSPDGGVVEIVVTAAEGGVAITVRDHGPGIPRDDLPNLFTPFFTGGAVERHSSGEFSHMSRGVGLGLSVVKRFVELHGGEVVVDTSTSGTTVRVRLPFTPQPAPTAGAETFDSINRE